MPRVRVVVECDENQHRNKGGDYSCDEQRMSDIGAERPDVPTIFVRFNPDKYGKVDRSSIHYKHHKEKNNPNEKDEEDDEDEKEGVDKHNIPRKPPNLNLDRRLIFLVAHLRAIFDTFTGDTVTLPLALQVGLSGVAVHYLYYDRDNPNCARSDTLNIQFYL